MKTLQVGNIDSIGNRFNGQDLHVELRRRGIDSSHCVWQKEWDDPDTWKMLDFRGRDFLNEVLRLLENRLSLQCMLPPFSHFLRFKGKFRQADLVHYHLIHTRFFSLSSLPALSRAKPSVWTLHDPWAVTGHCVYPYDCTRWQIGCGDCPNLSTYMPIREDRTAENWRSKQRIYRKSKLDLIVASKWMLDLVQDSPLMSDFDVHLVPFGLDLAAFAPGDVAAARRELGVFPDRTVLCLRSTNSEYKGMPYIKECLTRLAETQRLTVITLDQPGLLDEFIGRHQIIDLGWVDDPELAIKAYNAADIFLMPSLTEAFGMMAMEAMACGTPTIVFEGTSLPAVTHAPRAGVAVPMRDSDALFHAIKTLVDDVDRRAVLARQAREIACKEYDFDTHVTRLIDVYREVIEKRRAEDAD